MSNTTEEAHRRPPDGASRVIGRRRAAIDAFIDLVLERESAPTPEEIVARAGVSRATFFRYFETLDQLRSDAVGRVVERFPELFAIPEIGSGPVDERIRRFVDARFELHEALHALEFVSRRHAADDADTARLVDAVRQVGADQARRHFELDLHEHGPARRDDIVTAIAVLTSVESWQQFRRTHGRTPVQTRRAWRDALTALLTTPRDDPSGQS